MRSILLLLPIILFVTSCTKEEIKYAKLPAPEVRRYLLQTPSGDSAGIFTIGTNKDEQVVITIDILKKSNVYGTTYPAMICPVDHSDCYVLLTDVNAVIGYSETVNVKEYATGKILKADELFCKTGYRIFVKQGSEVIAFGSIR